VENDARDRLRKNATRLDHLDVMETPSGTTKRKNAQVRKKKRKQARAREKTDGESAWPDSLKTADI